MYAAFGSPCRCSSSSPRFSSATRETLKRCSNTSAKMREARGERKREPGPMMRNQVNEGRRTVLRLFVSTGLAGALAPLAWASLAAELPAIVYIRKVTADLFAAHKLGTVSAFLPPIQRHADVEA